MLAWVDCERSKWPRGISPEACQQLNPRRCSKGDAGLPSSLVEPDPLPSESFDILLSDLKSQATAFAMWRRRALLFSLQNWRPRVELRDPISMYEGTQIMTNTIPNGLKEFPGGILVMPKID